MNLSRIIFIVQFYFLFGLFNLIKSSLKRGSLLIIGFVLFEFVGAIIVGYGQKAALQSAEKMIWPGVQGTILLFLLDFVFATISKVNFMKSDIHQNIMNAKELYDKWKI